MGDDRSLLTASNVHVIYQLAGAETSISFFRVKATCLPLFFGLSLRCAGGLRMIQDFLGMPGDLLETESALTPATCEQKRTELFLYRMLNQVDSPAARVKVKNPAVKSLELRRSNLTAVQHVKEKKFNGWRCDSAAPLFRLVFVASLSLKKQTQPG